MEEIIPHGARNSTVEFLLAEGLVQKTCKNNVQKENPRNSTVEEMFVKGFVKKTPEKQTFIPQHRFSLFFAHYMRLLDYNISCSNGNSTSRVKQRNINISFLNHPDKAMIIYYKVMI